VFQKYGLEYDDRDIINNPDIYAEMVQKSGQPLSPCVEVNGQMLADVSGEEVETWLVDNKVVETVAG
jgi:monothiol glutaredoxin